VAAASYDEATKRWSITTDKGETFQAQYFISCAGISTGFQKFLSETSHCWLYWRVRGARPD
jgi:hypothetical protein